jgi:nucleoid DNA-binding protein
MNTADVKQVVYDKCKQTFDPPLTKTDISFIVDATLDAIAAGLITGRFEHRPGEEDKVLLRGFGTFWRKVRQGRAYKVRGESYNVPDRATVVFKPGAELLRGVRGEEKPKKK